MTNVRKEGSEELLYALLITQISEYGHTHFFSTLNAFLICVISS